MKLNIIASINNNNCIGGNNTLLWKQSNDLKRFKELTTNNIIIMGKKTFQSLDFKPLKNRIYIILSSDKNTKYFGCKVVHSTQESLDYVKTLSNNKEVFIIGGGIVYDQFFDLVNKLYITKIDSNSNGDTYFPKIENDKWIKTFSEHHGKDEKNQYDYTFEIYDSNLNFS